MPTIPTGSPMCSILPRASACAVPKVIIGYCNHQMLVAASANATAICSGTWMNVRSFPPDKFRTNYDEEIKQRATWYYAPSTLSEYKLPFLDIAHRLKLLRLLQPPKELANSYSAPLFQARNHQLSASPNRPLSDITSIVSGCSVRQPVSPPLTKPQRPTSPY